MRTMDSGYFISHHKTLMFRLHIQLEISWQHEGVYHTQKSSTGKGSMQDLLCPQRVDCQILPVTEEIFHLTLHFHYFFFKKHKHVLLG